MRDSAGRPFLYCISFFCCCFCPSTTSSRSWPSGISLSNKNHPMPESSHSFIDRIVFFFMHLFQHLPSFFFFSLYYTTR